VAFPEGDFRVINFAVCWNDLVAIHTFNSENYIGYVQSAGNLSFLSCLITLSSAINVDKDDRKADKSTSETTREISFNFEAYRKLSGVSPEKISDDWLT
jgi:hypothetical protein